MDRIVTQAARRAGALAHEALPGLPLRSCALRALWTLRTLRTLTPLRTLVELVVRGRALAPARDSCALETPAGCRPFHAEYWCSTCQQWART